MEDPQCISQQGNYSLVQFAWALLGREAPLGYAKPHRLLMLQGFAIKRRRLPPSVSPLSARATNIRPLSDVLLHTTQLK